MRISWIVLAFVSASVVGGCATKSSFKPRGTNIDVSACPDFITPHIPERRGQVGRVEAYFWLKADGTVENPRISLENPPDLGLGNAVIANLMQCHFRPLIKDGAPVATEKHI